MKNKYDVIVIGAGPAGSLAAKYAAAGGVDTLLVEKHPVIGYPLCCAEAISTTGLSNVVEPDPRWICSRIDKVHIFGPDNTKGTVNHPKAGFVLERKIFDRAMAENAAIAGAEVQVAVDVVDLIIDSERKICGIKADANGTKIELEADIIIAADGVESKIARIAGLSSGLKPRNVHSAYQYYLADIDIEPNTLEFYLGTKEAPGGYIWLFCKSDNSANVGIGISPTKSPDKKAKEYLDEFIERRFDHFQIVERMTGGVPSYIPDLPLVQDNLLLVGDAARVIDSFSGAGIANALLSGKIAGETAALMVKDGISAQRYVDEFGKLKAKEIKYYYHCRELFLKMTDSDLKSIVNFIEDLFGGREVSAFNPFEVVKKVLLAHPGLLKLGRHLLF